MHRGDYGTGEYDCGERAAMDSGEVPSLVVADVFRNLVLMLAPFAPFLAAELWETIGGEGRSSA
jgi:leucyl-tRNA synthetase